jgi:hypothetical protein
VVEKKDQHYEDLNKWVDGHSYGLQSISIKDAKSPESEYRARLFDQEHVNSLARDFETMQRVHQQSIFVALFPEEHSLPSRKNFNFQLGGPLYQAVRKHGFYFIAGDHTQRALKQIHADFPNNPKWATVTGQLLICHRTLDNFNRLKSWGILDNVVGDKRRAMTFQEKVLGLHEDHESLLMRVGRNDPTFRGALTALKKARQRDFAMNKNSFGQLWGLAAREGQVWECLVKIITGNVNNKRFQKPKSASPFTTMANIAEEDLVVMLTKVVNGTHSLTQFRAATKVYKARVRVQSEILQYPAINLRSWEEGKARFPNTCCADLVNIWAQHIVDAKVQLKHSLPNAFIDMVQARLEVDLNLNKSNRIIGRVRQFIISVQRYDMFFNLLIVEEPRKTIPLHVAQFIHSCFLS